MSREKILVPLGPDSKDLKGLNHALALAERIDAIVYVLFFHREYPGLKSESMIEEACLEVVQSACEEGLTVYYHIAENEYEQKLSETIDSKDIDLIVISNNETVLDKVIRGMLPDISCQVIQVKEKNNINYLQ